MKNIESINKNGQKEGRETNDFEDLELAAMLHVRIGSFGPSPMYVIPLLKRE